MTAVEMRQYISDNVRTKSEKTGKEIKVCVFSTKKSDLELIIRLAQAGREGYYLVGHEPGIPAETSEWLDSLFAEDDRKFRK
jgi:hypothetical protein